MRQNVVAYLALFVAFGGTSAYAANTVFSTDIVDNQVYSADVRDDTLSGGGLGSIDIANGEMTTNEIRDDTQPFGGLFAQDLAANSVGTSEVATSSLTGPDIQNGSLTSLDIASSTLNSDDVIDNALTGADINESTLNLPQTPTTATFAGPPAGGVLLNDTFTKVAGKTLPAGSYAVAATANFSGVAGVNAVRDLVCELRNGGGFIGGATDRSQYTAGQTRSISLSMNGGAQVPAGDGEVSLWCRLQGGGGAVDYGQMMIIRLDGFF